MHSLRCTPLAPGYSYDTPLTGAIGLPAEDAASDCGDYAPDDEQDIDHGTATARRIRWQTATAIPEDNHMSMGDCSSDQPAAQPPSHLNPVPGPTNTSSSPYLPALVLLAPTSDVVLASTPDHEQDVGEQGVDYRGGNYEDGPLANSASDSRGWFTRACSIYARSTPSVLLGSRTGCAQRPSLRPPVLARSIYGCAQHPSRPPSFAPTLHARAQPPCSRSTRACSVYARSTRLGSRAACVRRPSLRPMSTLALSLGAPWSTRAPMLASGVYAVSTYASDVLLRVQRPHSHSASMALDV